MVTAGEGVGVPLGPCEWPFKPGPEVSPMLLAQPQQYRAHTAGPAPWVLVWGPSLSCGGQNHGCHCSLDSSREDRALGQQQCQCPGSTRAEAAWSPCLNSLLKVSNSSPGMHRPLPRENGQGKMLFSTFLHA